MKSRANKNIAPTIIAAGVVMAMLYYLRQALVPLVLAFVLAILLDALVRLISHRLRAPRVVIIALAALVVLSAALIGTLVIANGAIQIARDAPALVDRIDQLVEQGGRIVHLHRPLHLTTLTDGINFAAVAANVVGTLGGFLAGFLLMITYFIFVVAGRGTARSKFAIMARPTSWDGKIDAVVEHIAKDVETYLWVQTATGLMIAAVSTLLMFAVGLHNALFWGIVLFLLCYIPMVGVTVGSVLPALFALVQFSTWWQAALVSGGVQVAAFFVGNFVYPRMQAETQNIDPVVSLIALAFWGSLWGLAGAFLAVPLTLMIMMICAAFPGSKWVAVMLSNDGQPSYPVLGSLAPSSHKCERRAICRTSVASADE